MKGVDAMDYSKKTARECAEDYERYGATVFINDGKVRGEDAVPPSCQGEPRLGVVLLGKEVKYTDYCTTFYDARDGMVYFYDEMKNRMIGKQEVSGKEEAAAVMQEWQGNAPRNVICEMLQ